MGNIECHVIFLFIISHSLGNKYKILIQKLYNTLILFLKKDYNRENGKNENEIGRIQFSCLQVLYGCVSH